MLIDGITFARVGRRARGAAVRRAARAAPGAGAPAVAARRRARGPARDAAPAGVRTLILASSAVLLFAGMLNVVELLFARNELGVGDSGFSILVALGGAGIVIGSALGARARRRSASSAAATWRAAAAGRRRCSRWRSRPSFAIACPLFVRDRHRQRLVLVLRPGADPADRAGRPARPRLRDQGRAAVGRVRRGVPDRGRAGRAARHARRCWPSRARRGARVGRRPRCCCGASWPAASAPAGGSRRRVG